MLKWKKQSTFASQQDGGPAAHWPFNWK